ncbi:acyl-CoA synthetase (AMP-forming)/AMP-acid ligase II [Tamaricihabitans halophyticus]|uniref:Acyl-CoA synthetase (AMP-forming)/AMP-acid ligase II n=2 Tax=Tamaricihabitans halophyticus TaxID=1262583 RepID=A0A4R2PVD5_9PSEU|nr:acyl-CoA synthetase (AMP-forming)/AMP-acid ligase II [Tamaricihabitans halophyticus]
MLNLGRFISRAASYWPMQEALVCGPRRWSYAELEERTNRLASALLRRGVRDGAAVATFAANRAELVEVEVALYKAGLLRVPINARLGGEEAAHILTDADVQVLFSDAAHVETALTAVRTTGRDIPVVVFDDHVPGTVPFADLLDGGDTAPVAIDVEESLPCVLNFTSGSTGKLKAAVQTTGNRLANMRKRLMAPVGSNSTEDRYLVTGPITHASGMGVLASLSRGTTIVVMPAFTAVGFLELIEQERVTATFLVPTMLNMVLAVPGARDTDLSSLRSVRVGGAPVSPQRLKEAVELFGPVVFQGYGQGETTGGITLLTAEDVVRGITSDPDLLLSCGRALFDTELRVVDDEFRPVPPGTTGELVVRGPDCVDAYWNEPALSAETFRDGWVLTGDIAYLREDGYLFIVDRKKDMIISGGFNIYCTEVEAAVYEHPAVAEACVVGVPDEKWGEAVKAVVVPKPGAELDTAELIAFCADRLDSLKKPRSVDVVDSLPVNRNGKIDRRAVRAPYWASSDRAVN